MECYIQPTIDFSKVSLIVAMQKSFVLQRIRKRSSEDMIRKSLLPDKCNPSISPVLELNEDDNKSDVSSNGIELSLSQLWQPELSKVPSECCSSSIQARPSEQIRSDMKSSDNIVHIEKIPGMLEAGWTQSNYLGAIGSTGGVDFGGAPRYDSDREYTAMLSTLIQLWKEVNKHASAWPFRSPVDLEEVPDYLVVIKVRIRILLIYSLISRKEADLKMTF